MNDQRKTILVVDDTADFRWMAGIILEEAGYDLAFACNGVEALDYLHSHAAPAAIVLDLSLPVMNGWDFLERQRQEAELALIPVVLYSCDPNVESKAVGRGVAVVLPKTANRTALTATVKRVINH